VKVGTFDPSIPLIVSFGGGTNSTAMLCGFRERGIKPDLVIFADTGNERDYTYEHVAAMTATVQMWWGIELETVYPTRKGKRWTLEQDCLKKGLMPSLAYGRRSCSQRFKHEPLEKRLVEWMRYWEHEHVTKAIGYGIDEPGRGKKAPDVKQLKMHLRETYWYPLREWRWDRAACVEAIKRHGLPLAGKSACWFCPSSKPSEVLKLRVEAPELLARALEIERRAQARNTTPRGLGGAKNLWANWLNNSDNQGVFVLDLEPMHIPCGCSDGN